MSPLDRKLWRDIRHSRGMLLAIVSIIAVGVSCQVGLNSTYTNLITAQERYYRQCRMADFWIDLKKVPLAELDQLAETPGITEIRSRIQFAATVDLAAATEPLNGLVISLPPRHDHVINDVVVTSGSYFTDHRANEVIVNDAFAAAHDLAAGDYLHLLLNNRRQELFVVGTAISSEFCYLLGPGALMPDPEHFGVFYVKRGYAEDVFDFDGAANQVVGRMAPEVRDRPQSILNAAETLLESYGVFAAIARKDQASHQYLSNELEGLGSFGTVMPAVFLTVAALVLNVLMKRMVEQQRVVVGTLKALGYTNRQVVGHFLKFGVSVGAVGGVAGCVMGYAYAYAMTVVYGYYFEFPDLENRFQPTTAVWGLAASLVFSGLGSLQGVRGVIRLNPAESMRPEPPRRGGAIWLERIRVVWRQFGFAGRMALRNVFRNRLRTGASLFASAMGASLLMCGLMMAAATFYLVDFQFHRLLRSDVELTFQSERSRAALDECQRLPGVDYAEPLFGVACTFRNGSHHRRGGITGIQRDARLTVPRDEAGRPLDVPRSGLVMTQAMADVLHVSRGDLVTIEPIKGLRRSRRVPVAQITDAFMGLGVYADLDYASRLVGEEFAMTGAQLVTDRNADHRAELYRELKKLPALENATARDDMIRSLNETLLKNMWAFLGVLVVFAGVIFCGSILNASLISLNERRREVATMRVLGYTENYIGAVFLRESLLVNGMGTVLGLPMGYALTWLIAEGYNNELLRLPIVAPAWVWTTTIVLGFSFTLLAHLVVQRVIYRTPWFDALNVKE